MEMHKDVENMKQKLKHKGWIQKYPFLPEEGNRDNVGEKLLAKQDKKMVLLKKRRKFLDWNALPRAKKNNVTRINIWTWSFHNGNFLNMPMYMKKYGTS